MREAAIGSARLAIRIDEVVAMALGKQPPVRTAVVLAAAGIAMLAAGYLVGKFLA
jgi:hypothetical protein